MLMKNLKVLAILFLAVACALTLWGNDSVGDEKLLIVTTTTLSKDLAEQIGKDLVQVDSIIPSGTCPAHYDLSPSEYMAVKGASLIIHHGVEGWLDDLIKASGNEDITRFNTGPPGQWNTPPKTMEKIRGIEEILSKIDPANATYYKDNAHDFIQSIEETSSELKVKAEDYQVSAVKVIVMQWQKGFVNWLGFQVIADYPPPETVSAKEYADLVNKGRQEEASLVIDNKQSGTDLGAKLAEDIGAEQVILTNFPGAFEGTETYQQMIKYNADQLFGALKNCEGSFCPVDWQFERGRQDEDEKN